MASLPATNALSERAAHQEEIAPPLPDHVAAPVQETGLRRRRATPYVLDARLRVKGTGHALVFANRSAARAAVFHVYDVGRLDAVPARYTVGADRELAYPLPVSDPVSGGPMDLFVIGPNGFHRRLTGRGDVFSVSVEGGMSAPPSLRLENLTAKPQSIAMTDRAYGAAADVIRLAGGEVRRVRLDLTDSHGWYDRQFAAGGQTWRMAGHVETGKASWSDPAAGGPGSLRLASST
jgi:phospholipase C